MPDTAAIQPELPPLNLNPCIFVGIGTTGLAILEQLRRLFYEEFGVAGLQCFRYLVLETDRDNQAKDGFLPYAPRPHERIDLIPMTVPDLGAIRRTPNLDAWLDPRTLKFSKRGYENGAGHRRQAGRLCLWENWPSVRDAISKAVVEVNTRESRMDADRFLRETYFARKRPGTPLLDACLVDAVPRVYLVGTLCGGTCSGVFLDVAFFFRSLLQVRSRNNLRDAGSSEIVGLFTIPDTICIQREDSLPNVASCWAALSELDYYTKDDTVYELRFPDQPQFITREPPFTTTYLVSRRNTGKTGFTPQDADGLHQMCAMNLFTEVVAGMADNKAANRANLPAAGSGFLTNNASGYIRAASSFGLSAIWYPRYRIAKAICRSLGKEMAEDWLGSDNFQPTKVEEALRSDWQSALDWACGSLLGTVHGAHCSVHLPDAIARLFDHRQPEFMEAGRDGLERCVLDFPGGDTTIGQRLGPGGEFYRQVATAAQLLAPDLRNRLREMVVRFLRGRTFAETRYYVNTLQAWVKAKDESVSPQLAPYSQRQDLSGASEVYADRATWILGLRGSAIEEYKTSVWSRYRQSTLGYLDHLRDHFLKQALAVVREDLTVLGRLLENAAAKLTMLRETCVREREELVKCPHSTNIVILSEGRPDSIADDVELGAAAILQETPVERLRAAFLRADDINNPNSANEHDPIELLERRFEVLMSQIEKSYESLAQPRAARFQIGHAALRTAAAQMQNLVHSSAPYFEPSPEWRPMTTPQPPNFLFCSGQEIANRLADEANRHLLGTTYACRPSTLDHFVFFYQETPGLALSDFAIAQFAAERLEAEESKPGNAEPTRFSHKLGRRMFDPRAVIETARQWAADALALGPELFDQLEGQPYLRYRADDDTSRDVYVKDEVSVREFTRTKGLSGFIQLLAGHLATLKRPALIERMDKRKEAARTREERDALTARHQEILNMAFPVQS